MKKLLIAAAAIILTASCKKETKCYTCETYRDGVYWITEQHCTALPLDFYNATGVHITFNCK